MNKQLKVGIVLSVACILAVLLAACGGNSGSDESSGTGADSEITGTVTVWDFEYESFPSYTKVVKQLDSEFEQRYPGVTVKREGQPLENYEAIYRAAFTAHEGPDVMLMQPGYSGVLSFANGLEDLSERVTPEMEEELTLWEAVTPGLKAEGARLGVPLTLQGWVFYYNKQLFAKAGLPTDFQPKTWAELREAGETLQAAGIQPFTGGNKEGDENWGWFTLGFQSVNTPTQTSELAEGALPFTDDAVAKALGPEIEMQEAGLYPSDRFSTSQFTEGYSRFEEGEGAMILGFWTTSGYWGDFGKALGEKNLGMFYPPGNAQVGSLSAFVDTIPSFAKNKDAAWALIEFESSKKAMEAWYGTGGFLPNRRDVNLPADAPVQAQQLLADSKKADRVVAPFAALPSAVAFQTLPAEMNQVLQGRTSLAQAQQAMQETAEKTATQ